MPFERLAQKYGWTGAERVDRLHECLRGVAIRYVCSLPEHIREDYTLLKEQLTQRFGVKDPPTTVRRKLGELRQGKESPAEFAEEVQRLVSLAYPGTDLLLQDQLATDAFLKGLKNQKGAYEVMNRDPQSLAEAQKLAEAHEHNFRATLGRDQDIRTGRARRVSWADEDGNFPDELLLPSARRLHSPKYVTEEQFKLLMDKVEQLHLKLEHLQPVAKDCGSVGTMERFAPHVNRTPEQERGRRLARTPPPQNSRARSPSPNQATRATCFRCGEVGHLMRECSRSPSPARHRDIPSKGNPEPFRKPMNEENGLPHLQLGRTTKRGPSLQIEMTVNGLPIQAIVDTGAEAMVISEEVYNMLPLEEGYPLKKTSLRNAEAGSKMTALGDLEVTLEIGSRKIKWKVFVSRIHDSLLLGLDAMQAADVTVFAGRQVFVGKEPVPTRVIKGDGEDYSVACVLLEDGITLPPESECLAWGKVDRPKPGFPAVLEPLNITEAVSSGSVATYMDTRVPVRLCNFSSDKASLPSGVCVGILVEIFPDDSPMVPVLESGQQKSVPEGEGNDVATPMVGRVTRNAVDLPEHLQALYTSSSEILSGEQQGTLIELLLKYQSLFAASDTDLGHLSAVTHKIDTGTARPVRQPVRRTPLGFQGEDKKHLKEMLEAGVVVILVRKKDGGVRWCVDYRRLNSLTLRDAYPLPKIDECLDVLGEATVFSTLDLQCGYWQIAVDPKDRGKTAFITRYRLYEYTRMPFGLCNAPGTFQRAMELVLRGFQWKTLLIYLDDIIILGRGVDENLQRLGDVFERLHNYGLKLKPKKCQLLKDKVLFLGHVVSGEVISPNPALIKDVQEWQPPINTQQLQAFLGLCNYYRRFVPAFAELASPLNDLLKKTAQFQWGETA